MVQLDCSKATQTEDGASRSSSPSSVARRCTCSCKDNGAFLSPTPLPSVLSLQSHVARSCVGGAAFTFPLQRQGFHVNCIYTTQFVDMYVHEGTILSPLALRTLLEGVSPTPSALHRMLENENCALCLKYAASGRAAKCEREHETDVCSAAEKARHSDATAPQSTENSKRSLRGWSTRPHNYIASGFIGSRPLISEFSRWLYRIHDIYAKENCTRPLYLCDPVLGDGGHVYVPPECLPAYARLLLPLADIITPNSWEAMWLAAYAEQSASNLSGSQKYAQQEMASEDEPPHEQRRDPASGGAGAGWQPFTSSDGHEGVHPVSAPRTISDAVFLVNQLHTFGPEIVIITSVDLPDEVSGPINDGTQGSSQRVAEREESSDSASYLYLIASRQARNSPRCTPSCWSPAGVRELKCSVHPQNDHLALSAAAGSASARDVQGQSLTGEERDDNQTDLKTRLSRCSMHVSTPTGFSHSSKASPLKGSSEGPLLREKAQIPSNSGENERQTLQKDLMTESEDGDVVYVVRFPKLATPLCGTGDTWAALFLAAFHKSRFCLRTAIEIALSGTQAAIRHTFKLHGRCSECIDVIGSCGAVDAAPVLHRAVRIQRSCTRMLPSGRE
ncbi:pyridoxal kinase [Toxoplasma gondii GAB2-2007-GAL-DOM2]|uniref:pyridoxal kinase n=5 Tax=Toxoplasma gondii TaxID=5811 RepID=B9QHK1_TOXGV|nr:pyridoxal kinase [Toxoplasma gondii VEG]KFG29834.1 pyridoxal kinase [Toxoplasma gondii p89]KFG41839.1 pyridoxal kinase [Toxoplasma gondii GAB2-2007-GAL-DOM2]KFH00881.1 pyridoxal kinase [Toxoplasma gondii VAND]RQX67462.1 pyridoxal kinase [Toxoplasma gondii CAST]